MSRGAAVDWGPDEIVVPPAGKLRVGRGRGCEVVIGHPTVADPHAVLLRTVAGLQVRDLARGRTRVNGRAFRELATLRTGDRVEFGSVAYAVESALLRRVTRLSGLGIVADHLTVERGARRVLEVDHLEIAPGELVGLLGPSGAGKSTLLKCLAGYLRPAPGSRLKADELVLPEQLASYRPLIGYVPQEDVVFPTLTVRENLDYALRLRTSDLGPGERQALIDAVLGQLGVADRADAPAGSISPGQRKRVCVAQELLTRPRALFLDEPTSGLDPAHETRIMKILVRLAEQGVTVVCATHVLENVELFGRVVVVVRGRVAYDGPPGQLLGRFGATRYPELYVNLENEQPRYEPPPRRVSAPATVKVDAADIPPSIGQAREVGVQMARGARLIRRDLVLLALLIGQPLMIGLLIGLSQVSNTETSTLVTFTAVTCVWLGLNNTARELVRDRRAYVRERLIGITPTGHLAAKVLLFAAVGLAQVSLLYLVLRAGGWVSHDLAKKVDPLPAIGFLGVLWLTYLGGQLLGLLVSAFANSQEVAVAVLPLLVLPQLLLTGSATEMTQKGRFHSAAYLYWTEGQPPRSASEWLVELIALPLYTRPSVSLWKRPFVPDGVDPAAAVSPAVAAAVDLAHLSLLVAVTAVALVVVFRWRERRWMTDV